MICIHSTIAFYNWNNVFRLRGILSRIYTSNVQAYASSLRYPIPMLGFLFFITKMKQSSFRKKLSSSLNQQILCFYVFKCKASDSYSEHASSCRYQVGLGSQLAIPRSYKDHFCHIRNKVSTFSTYTEIL